ncbi:uncharacterized protein LOC120336446 isoform X2 [Styela clava]
MMLAFRSFVLALFIFESTSGAAQGIFQCKMKVQEFPIVCEARGQQRSNNVLPEIINDNEEIDVLKQELRRVERTVKEQNEQLVILKYENRQTKDLLRINNQINKRQAEELIELRTENTKTQEQIQKQKKELKIIKDSLRALMKEGATSKPSPVFRVKPTTVAEHEGALRLVDGRNNKEGRVEIFHAGKWGTICDREFEIDEANAVCYTLGFSGAKFALGQAHFGSGAGPIWIAFEHTCSDENTDFYHCHGTFGKQTYLCDHEDDASVVCN